MKDPQSVVASGRFEEMKRLRELLRGRGLTAELVRPPGAGSNG